MNLNPIIYRLAKEARDYIERISIDFKRIDNETLCGACGLASCKLFSDLKRHGINATIAVTEDIKQWRAHAFIIIDRNHYGYIIDVTATQFGDFKNIEIFRMEDAKLITSDFLQLIDFNPWDYTDTFNDVEQFQKKFPGLFYLQ